MNTIKSRLKSSRAAATAGALAILAGCAVVPAEPVGYYGGPPVAYAVPAPVVVSPSVSFGYYRGYGHRGWRHWR